MSLCEIRIATYKRPQFLARALDMLARQTVGDIHAVVFDDSPEQEGRAVAEGFEKFPVLYRNNDCNLGISGNLAQCFRTKPYRPADYCFCLEDDNTVLPNFIEMNIAALEQAGAEILIRNQYVETADNRIDKTRQTMPDAFPNGLVSPRRALTSLFSGIGLSNGGLFWHSKAKTQLGIGADCADPVLLEYLRPFALREPILYMPTPLGAWRENGAESFREQGGLGQRFSNYRLLKTLSQLRRRALPAITEHHGLSALYRLVDPSRWARVDTTLANALYPMRPRTLSAGETIHQYGKGLIAHTQKAKAIGTASRQIVDDQLHWLMAE